MKTEERQVARNLRLAERRARSGQNPDREDDGAMVTQGTLTRGDRRRRAKELVKQENEVPREVMDPGRVLETTATTPGAVRVGGTSSVDAGPEPEMQPAEQLDPAPISAQLHPVMLDAHLASDNVITVDAKPEPEETEPQNKLLLFVGVAAMLIIIGVVVGIAVGAWSTGSDDSKEPDPTGSPTTQEALDDSIVIFLQTSASNGIEFEPGGPQALAAEWIIELDPAQIKTISGKLLQRFALALFYIETTKSMTTAWSRCNPSEIDGDDVCIEDTGEANWLSGADECAWHGVSCDERSGEVDKINLRAAELVGTLPLALFLLSGLEYLDLFGNNFNSTIPDEVYDLSLLTHLDLSFMPSISGTLSPRVGDLVYLSMLNLERVSLSGSIPDSIGKLKELTLLSMSQASISGSIPSTLFDLSKLTSIRLDETLLEGTIDTAIGNLSLLEELLFQYNYLSGTIPTELGRCTNLRYIQLLQNRISGSIPSEVGRISRLQSLVLSGNNRLSGEIPEALYDLTYLEGVSVSPSMIGGTLSTKIGQLTNLRALIFGESQVYGTVPSEFGLLSPQLRVFNVRSTPISGSLPTEFYQLSKLRNLDLSDTSLSGTLSTHIGQLSSLEVMLFLVSAGLTGTLPTELGRLSNMSYFAISESNVRGVIPSEIGGMIMMSDFFLYRNPGVTGTIPEEIYDLEKAEIIRLDAMSLTGTISTHVGRLSNLKFLSLISNQLTGTVPSEFGLISTLQVLYTASTRLNGTVPEEICVLRDVGSLAGLVADCLPKDDPPVRCDCCTSCCARETGRCK